MSADHYREDLGAYVLGALPAEEADAVRAHLATCAACRHEYVELAGLPALLRTVPLEHALGGPPTPGTRLLDSVLAAVSAERGAIRRRRAVRMAAVSLGVAASAAAVTGVVVTTTSDRGDQRPAASSVVGASDRATGVWARVSVRSVAWGSSLSLSLGGVQGGDRCSLVAIARDGRQETAASWAVPPGGYGSGTKTLSLDGGVSIRAADLERFEVRLVGGDRLVAVPAHPVASPR